MNLPLNWRLGGNLFHGLLLSAPWWAWLGFHGFVFGMLALDLGIFNRSAHEPSAKEAALCALGKGAPNPVLSTLKYFKNEYIEHIAHKRCPAGVCKVSQAEEVTA